MDNTHSYKTHWHSFWFGFMSGLALVLLVILVLTITNRITFKNPNSKNVKITKDTETSETIANTATFTNLTDLVESLGMDGSEMQACVENGDVAAEVEADEASGKEAGVKGTPHSFVFIDDAIYEIPGAYDEEGMREFFDDLLAGNDPRAEDISADRTVAPVTEDDWTRGNDNARITVIEYSDIDCPYCKKFHASITNMLSDYSDDVQWVFRHMPIDTLHPNARAKAEAAECVGRAGGAEKFWSYIDTIFTQDSI